MTNKIMEMTNFSFIAFFHLNYLKYLFEKEGRTVCTSWRRKHVLSKGLLRMEFQENE